MIFKYFESHTKTRFYGFDKGLKDMYKGAITRVRTTFEETRVFSDHKFALDRFKLISFCIDCRRVNYSNSRNTLVSIVCRLYGGG